MKFNSTFVIHVTQFQMKGTIEAYCVFTLRASEQQKTLT